MSTTSRRALRVAVALPVLTLLILLPLTLDLNAVVRQARALAAAFQAAVAALPPGAAAGSRLFIDSARLNPRPLRAQLQLPGVHVLPGGPQIREALPTPLAG